MPDYDLAYKQISELSEDTSAPASNDFIPRYDDSTGEWKKVDSTDLSAMVGVSATASEIDAVADVSARLVDLDATTLTVTAATHGGKIITLSHTAAESVVTLPAATGTGNIYTH